jgi:photosystem II stability/assembly factor-like uncharacterized protein
MWFACLCLLAGCGGGGGGADGSDPAAAAFAIVAQPADVAVEAGKPASFEVRANAAAKIQWQRESNGTWSSVDGATSDTYAIDSPQLPDNGTRVRALVTSAANPADQLTSSAATLTVTAAGAAPVVVASPNSASVSEGQAVSFSVTASGTALTYQWQRSQPGSDFVDVAGATLTTLSIPTVSLSDDGTSWRVVVSNDYGSVTSSTAQLHVTATSAAPTFTGQPADVQVTAGQSTRFAVAVTGTPGPTIQWQSSVDGLSWAPLANQAQPTLLLSNVSLTDSGKHFRAVATNASGSVTSRSATLTVSAQAQAPVITHQPADVSVAVGASADFSVSATGVPSVSYQWQLSVDGGASFTAINGATSSSFTTAAATLTDNGKLLRVEVSNAAGSQFSQSARLTVIANPVITQQPSAQAWHPGVESPAFEVVASGGGLTYQWQRQLAGSGSFTDIAGATGATYVHSAGANDTTSAVRVIVSNEVGGSVVSSPAALTTLHWSYTSPAVTGDSLNALAWVDADHLVAAGAVGTVVHSTDAGATWSVVSESADASWDAYSFVQDQQALDFNGSTVGISVGANTSVRRSSDGGLHWLPVNLSDRTHALYAVAFSNSTTVVAAGASGTLLRSTDAGVTWTTLSSPSTEDIVALGFHGDIGLAATSAGHVLRTINAGAQWELLSTSLTGGASALAFADASTAVVAGYAGAIRTTDGGSTWNAVSIASQPAIGALHFKDSLHGVAVPTSASGTAYVTADGGASWLAANGWASSPSVGWRSVRFGSGGVAIATGDYGAIRRSTDGGATWTDLSARVVTLGDSLSAIDFANASLGVVVGDGTFLRTTDGGAHWSPASTPQGVADIQKFDWTSVAFANASQVTAIDQQGNLAYSADGGTTWRCCTYFNGVIPVGMAHIRFSPDGSVGLIAMASGYIARSTDGGASWDRTMSPVTACLSDVALPSASVAIAMTCSGAMRSTDGGQTWHALSIPASVHSVRFADAQVGVMIGDQSIFRTTDAGATWQTVMSPGTSTYNGLWFTSASEGYIVGDSGEVLRTSDAGLSWTVEQNYRSPNLTTGVALDAYTSLAVGGPGATMMRRSK